MNGRVVRGAIESGISFLSATQLATGELPAYSRFPQGGRPGWELESSPFATALAVISLGPVEGAEAIRAKAVRFLLDEMETPGVWRHFASISPYHTQCPPDVDDTACSSMAVNLEGHDTGVNRSVLIANRDAAGAFFTWIIPRFPLPVSLAWWRAGQRELVAWPRRRKFWRETSASPGDVDCIVNAHVVNYLGPEESTRAASAYLVDILVLGGENRCDTWYPQGTRLYYSVSRSIRDGNRILALASDLIVERVVETLDRAGDVGGVLNIALAAAALHNLGYREASYERAVSWLLAQQNDDGSWVRDPVYIGGPTPAPTWASEAVATAACLEVLAGYDRAPHRPSDDSTG